MSDLVFTDDQKMERPGSGVLNREGAEQTCYQYLRQVPERSLLP